MSLERARGISEANIKKFHAKTTNDLRKGKYTTRWIYCLHCRIELSVVFGVAGWVTYLQKEKGAPAGGAGGAGAETEDDEEGATPAQSNVEGSDGQ